MDPKIPLDHEATRLVSYRDPVRGIRLELDPTVNPSQMRRPSDLLAYGSRIPQQYLLFSRFAVPLRYVVKRHRATHLHTDFRLEAFGTLLSWAFWPHPSLDPRKMIAAREVGDHQVDFMNVERRIADGGYGAGPMVVWDYGTYRPLVRTHWNDEQTVVDSLQQGCLDFWVEGIKLNGGFRLETSRKGWTFAKLPDAFAVIDPEPWDDRSVLTGRNLDDIEREYQAGLSRLRRVSL